ncbi:MAG: hypothetical protein KHX13_04885 [Acidaminococcus intestini]|uniref:Uncharacterized protein n=1 Tax=Acidaminococcus intestini TaxID=187327 RepID=A0A943I487_9FIRM|nr:hypothetical protein [Acidaminococcus intestini]
MGTIGAVALSMGSALMNTYGKNRSLMEQGRANQRTAQGYVRSMNYSIQNLERQRTDAFEAAVDEMERINLQGYRLASGVDVAVNEGMMGGGRTAHLLKRSATADLARTLNSIKGNYTKKRNEIDLNKEATLLDTKLAISAIPDAEKPSLFGTLFDLGTAYLGGLQASEQIKLMREKAGVGVKKPTMAPFPMREAISALTGGSYVNPLKQVPMGNYTPRETYDELFGVSDFRQGLFYQR